MRSEFNKLAYAAWQQAVYGEHTGTFALCDYLQERNDPRAETIRLMLADAQARMANVPTHIRFQIECEFSSALRRTICSTTRKPLASPHCHISTDAVEPPPL